MTDAPQSGAATPDQMGIFDVMYNCRAMRRLDSREVPEALLIKLIDAANQAPIDRAFNMGVLQV